MAFTVSTDTLIPKTTLKGQIYRDYHNEEDFWKTWFTCVNPFALTHLFHTLTLDSFYLRARCSTPS